MLLPICCRWGLFLTVVLSMSTTEAFSSSLRRTRNSDTVISSQATGPRILPMQLAMAGSTLEETPISSFQQRLLQRMDRGKPSSSSPSKLPWRRHIQSPSVQDVKSLQDFKRVVKDENDDQLVVVWFYAPWCRSCKGVSKGVLALSRQYKDVKFVQVPVLVENTALHQGLGVKSVPFVHLYHPTEGLVEERKLTRKYLPGFHKLLQDYRAQECSLERSVEGEWSSSSPYEPVPKAKDMELEQGTSLLKP